MLQPPFHFCAVLVLLCLVVGFAACRQNEPNSPLPPSANSYRSDESNQKTESDSMSVASEETNQKADPEANHGATEQTLVTDRESLPVTLPELADTDEQEPSETKDDRRSYATRPTTALEQVESRVQFDLENVEPFRTRMRASGDTFADDLIQFAEQTIRATAYDMGEREWILVQRTRNQLEQAPIQAGVPLCDDPMYQLCDGLVDLNTGSPQKGTRKMEAAIGLLVAGDYDPQLSVFAYRKLIEYKLSDIATDDPSELLLGFREALKKWLAEESLENIRFSDHHHLVDDVRRFIISGLHAAPEIVDEFNEWFVQQTHVPRWLRYMIRGCYFHVMATNNMRRQNGELIFTHRNLTLDYLKKSAGFYRQAHEINPWFPEAASRLMIAAYHGQDDQSVDYWFEQARKAQPDLESLLYNRLLFIGYDHPESAAQSIFDFAKKIASENEFDTMAPMIVPQAYWLILERYSVDDPEFVQWIQSPELRAELIKIVDGFCASDRQAAWEGFLLPKSFFLTLKATWSAEAGDLDAADQAFLEIGESVNRRALNKLELKAVSFDVLRCKSYASTSEFMAEAETLSQLMGEQRADRSKNASEILELTETVLAENTHPVSSLFFQQARDQVQKELDFDNGKLIELKFDPAWSLWKAKDIDHLRYVTESTAVIDNRVGTPQFELTSICELPGAKTIAFDVEFLPSEDGEPGPNPFVVLEIAMYGRGRFCVGLGKPVMEESVEDLPNRGRLFFGALNGTNQFFLDVDLRDGINELLIHLDRRYFEVYLNDNFICRSAPISFDEPLDYFRVRQAYWSQERGQVRLANFCVRKWAAGKPPKHRPDDLLVYRQEQSDRRPDDKWHALWLAEALHAKGLHDEAMERYQIAVKNGMPQSKVGLFIGDLLEQQGKIEEALEWYRIAADAQTEDRTRLFARPKSDAYSTPEQWAAFRWAWWTLTSPDPATRASLDLKSLATPLPPEQAQWMVLLLQAQQAAIENRFDDAVEIAKKTLPGLTPDVEKKVLEVVAAYQQKQLYIQPPDTAPFYRAIKNPTPLNRYMEDHEGMEYLGRYH